MTIIKDETNKSTIPNLEMAKLQELTRTSVTDGTDRTPQWQDMTTDVKDAMSHKGSNTNEAQEVDPKLSPSQGFHRQPDSPKAPSHKELKINY